jgi:DNA-binding NarL/FixJ family response regulator
MAKTKKIFVVDDDEFYLQMLADHLSKNPGLEVRQFLTGEACLDSMYDDKPDVIILDYFLSDSDSAAATGMVFLERIKKVYPSIHVIMLSGQGKYGVAASTIAKGAAHYVVKDNDSFKNISSILNGL